MLAIKVLDRVADRFGRPAQFLGYAATDLRQVADAEAVETMCATQILSLLHQLWLLEFPALLNAILMGGQEGIRQRGQKSHLTPAVVQDRQTDQAALPPAVDRLRGHVELAAEFLQRQHRFV